MSKKVIYEKHPVSAKRKAELRNQGYKILDEKFKPDDVQNETDELSIEQIKAELEEAGVEFDGRTGEKKLREMYAEHKAQ